MADRRPIPFRPDASALRAGTVSAPARAIIVKALARLENRRDEAGRREAGGRSEQSTRRLNGLGRPPRPRSRRLPRRPMRVNKNFYVIEVSARLGKFECDSEEVQTCWRNSPAKPKACKADHDRLRCAYYDVAAARIGLSPAWAQAARVREHCRPRFRTIQVRPKDLPLFPRQPERAVRWHSGFHRGSP
jgi:hypothetical protein